MQSGTPPRPWWLAAIVVALGAISVWGASSLPAAGRYAGIGPGTVPAAVGWVLIVLGLILAVQIARGETFEPQGTENADAARPMNPLAFFLALVAATLPIFTLETVGLPLVAMASFALVARSFGSRRTVLDLVSGAILGSLAWFLFDRLGLQLGGFMPFAGLG